MPGHLHNWFTPNSSKNDMCNGETKHLNVDLIIYGRPIWMGLSRNKEKDTNQEGNQPTFTDQQELHKWSHLAGPIRSSLIAWVSKPDEAAEYSC